MRRAFGSWRGNRRAGASGEAQPALRLGLIVAPLALGLTIGGVWLGLEGGALPAGVARALAAADATAPQTQVTLAWRDADGQARAGRIDRAKFARFLEQQQQAVEQERKQTRAAAAAALTLDTTAIFAIVRARVPRYADWYFRYWTKYELMSAAARAALRHITVDTRSPPHKPDFIHSVETSLADYLQRQFAARVLIPSWTERELEAAFGRTLAKAEGEWRAFTEGQDQQLVEFVTREATPVAPATALEIGRADRAPPPPLLLSVHHQDVLETYSFRRGLLQVRVERARAASTKHPAGEIETENEEDAGGDKVTGVLVDMFTKIVDPMASRIGDLVVGAAAGGVAGAMAGGSSLTLVGVSGAASGVAAVVPLTALFGMTLSLASDYAANQFEESLSRPSFEQNIVSIVVATEDSIKKVLIATLSEQIDASRDDILTNTAIDRLVVKQ